MKTILKIMAAIALLCLPAAAATTITGTLCSGSTATVTLNRVSATGVAISRQSSLYTAGAFAESLQPASDGSHYDVTIACPASSSTQYWLIPDVASATTAQVSVASTVSVAAGWYWDSGSNAWKHVSAGISSSGGTSSKPIEHLGAICQDVAAATGFSLPTANAAVPACVTGSQTPNAKMGVLQFADSASWSAQHRFQASACSTVTADVYWRSSDTTISNTIIWALRTMFLGAGDVATTASWNTQQTVTANPITTANGQIKTTITLNAGSLTGCVAGKRAMYEISRDVTDTSTATAEITAIVWTLQ